MNSIRFRHLAASMAMAVTIGSFSQSAQAATAAELNADGRAALHRLYSQSAKATNLAKTARGILVFPKIVSAGFLIGGSYGEGALRKAGKNNAYYKVTGGSVGLLAGAQSKAMYLLFMTPDALQKFESSDGWTAGADASVVVADVGANASIDTKTAQAPIIGFVRSTAGLMANVSIDGTKFTKLML